MNRNQKRERLKNDKKLINKKKDAMKWFNSLSPEKKDLIKYISNTEADNEQNHIIQAIERCYTAGIIEVLEDAITIKDIEEIMEKCTEFLVEDAKKVNEEKVRCKGDYKMAVKKINAIANEVGNRIRVLIQEGTKAKELPKIISYEYPTLTKAMITNSIKRIKEEMKEVEAVKTEISREEAEKELLDILGVVEDSNEVIPGATEIIDEAVKNVIDDEFEIISEVKILDLKGKHGTYHIEKNVMQVNGEKSFCNEKEVTTWASDEIAKLAIKIESIKQKENEAIRVLEKFM